MYVCVAGNFDIGFRESGFYLGIKFWGGSLSITVNDCAQDMHIDLMHVLYVYSRVMGGGSTYKV